MRNGDVTRASELFAAANKLDPGDANKRTRLAVSKYAQGDATTAMSDLEQIAASDSGTSADMALIAGHLRRNEFDAALKAIAALEKKQPNNALPHEVRGRILLAKRDNAGARKSFERALEINPAYFPATRGLAELDLIEKKPQDAEQRFEKLVAADGKNAQARLALAALKARSGGTTEEVAALISKAVTARPDEMAPRLALIELYLRAKDARKAIAAGQDAAAALPTRPEIQEMLGQALLAAGEYNQALSAFAKQAQLQTSSVRPYLRMAEANIIAKKPEAAAENLRKALDMKPDLVEAQRGLIVLDMRSGKGEKSIAIAREVQKQRPTEAIGYILEGDIAAARKAWPDAANAYRAGLKQAPATELATRLHGALYTGGNKAEADRFAQGWIKEHAKDYGFQLYLGESAIARNDLETASTVYRSLLQALPDNPVIYNNLAWVTGKRKGQGAIEYAEKANSLAPNQPAFMDTLGMLLAEKGDLARATELLGKAVELAPQAAGIRLNYAKVLIQAGKKPEARKQLDEIAKLGDKVPEQAEVAQLIKTL
jgi:putative PEP-CTERM system TPR-repeat lipoprotein